MNKPLTWGASSLWLILKPWASTTKGRVHINGIEAWPVRDVGCRRFDDDYIDGDTGNYYLSGGSRHHSLRVLAAFRRRRRGSLPAGLLAGFQSDQATLVDSTGVKLNGPGEWLVERHGTQRRRAWRKLHLSVDAVELGALIDQIDDPLAAVVADGAYDQDRVYNDVAGHSPEAAVIVPPRATAVLSASAARTPSALPQDQRTREKFVIVGLHAPEPNLR